jgi:hypothetical protein
VIDMLAVLALAVLAYLVYASSSRAWAARSTGGTARVYSPPPEPSKSLLEDVLTSPSSGDLVPSSHVGDDRLYGANESRTYTPDDLATVGDDRLYQ